MKSLKLILSNPRYFAPAWVFASLNILFGTWAIYIPTIKEKLALDNSELGIAIFFLSLGVFTVFPMASALIGRLGVGKATWVGVLGCVVLAIFPFLATNYYMSIGSLFLFGFANGFTDIAMNTLVTELEKEDQENFMSAAHGFFSLGGVLAGLGSFLIPKIGSPIIHMCLAMLLVLSVNAFLVKNYRHITAGPIVKEPFSFKVFKPLFVLGMISFVIMGSEGAVVDWSSLYLKEIRKAPENLIGAGFLGFSITMTTGRFFADGISSKIGSFRLITFGSILALLGYILVLQPFLYSTILGFACIGLGLSVIIPEMFRIGGTIQGVESSKGVSFIAGTGYSGFLLAPVLLGFIAEKYDLNLIFYLLLGSTILVVLATLLLQRKK
ncbi:MFS transporter [Spongiimicrobium salis]|uniref:MFS transporter n=1 Tax=Spongiimicrobium salis TaxID=1667022 RepID=UPI00374CDB61